MLVAADCADREGHHETASVLRETADAWNDNIERWTYVSNTEFARLAGVDGYYTRIAPPEAGDASAGADALPTGYVAIRNRPVGSDRARYEHLVSPDALALVRFGLRDANDQRIRNTVRVIDALICRRTKTGPTWHRYNDDGYGEHEDGSPYDGVGIGRGWPLLGAVPYLATSFYTRPLARWVVRTNAALLAGDAVAFAALVEGSLAARTVVL